MISFLIDLFRRIFKKEDTSIISTTEVSEPKSTINKMVSETKKITLSAIYCQKDKRWANLKIGKTKLTLREDGCYITSIAMLDGRTPDVVLKILNTNNCFDSKGCLKNYEAAKVLGYNYSRVKRAPKTICVAETNFYAKRGYPQHFFIWLNNEQIVDPLTGKIINNKYPIISYRIFSNSIA